MKIIIAGSRSLKGGIKIIQNAVENSPFFEEITEVVSGTAPGIDTLGEAWAELNEIPIKQFPADWSNLKAPNSKIKNGKYGKYNAAAGMIRNKKMAEYADGAIILWDSKSHGTSNTITECIKNDIPCYVEVNNKSFFIKSRQL